MITLILPIVMVTVVTFTVEESFLITEWDGTEGDYCHVGKCSQSRSVQCHHQQIYISYIFIILTLYLLVMLSNCE